VGMTNLGTLGGNISFPFDINAAGQVVGAFNTDTGAQHAFITGPNGMGMTDLDTLGGSYNGAFSINASGQVVGYYTTATGVEHAFITGPNGVGMTDLNSLVSLPGGVVLSEATGINNHGQVVAIGSIPAVPGIPEPETYALLLAGLGLIGFMSRRRKAA
jgi:probable HAF family extracellular repeat protein